MDYSHSFTIKDLEENQGRVVFSAPAGTGKTTAVADYIAKHWETESCIFVSQTIKSLDAMEQMLIERGVPSETIFNYNSSSEIIKSLTPEEIDKRCKSAKIVLITHTRLAFDSPYNYCEDLNGIIHRDNLFIDESVNPVVTVEVPKTLIDKSMKSIILQHKEYEGYSIYLEKNQYNLDPTPIAKLLIEELTILDDDGAYLTPKGNGMTISDGDKSFSPFDKDIKSDNWTINSQIIRRITNLYTCIAIQIVKHNFVVMDRALSLTVPISIPETWYKLIDNIAILDATGYLYSGFYKKFKINISNNWNWNKVNLHLKNSHLLADNTVINSLSKTQLLKLTDERPKEIFRLLDTIGLQKYKRIYFVTYKGSHNLHTVCDETDSYFTENQPDKNTLMGLCVQWFQQMLPNYTIYDDEQFHEEENIIHLTNYGRTRGSNAFRNCDCVVLLGDFRYDETKVIQNIKKCYPEVDGIRMALAHFIQEIYRSRIRCDEPVDVYSFNDLDITKAIQNEGIIYSLDTTVADKKKEEQEEKERTQLDKTRELFLTCPSTRYHKALVECFNKYHAISLKGIYESVTPPYSNRDCYSFLNNKRGIIEQIFNGTVDEMMANIHKELYLK